MRIVRVPGTAILLAGSLSLVIVRDTQAASETKFKIEPGPRVMSAAEAALQPDPDTGSQHGIILVDETTRTDFSTGLEISHRIRARIFTNEGRALADITIPYSTATSDLRKWWGWTILPDGRTVELPRGELKEGVPDSEDASDVTVLKGAIPGVVPGSVIEYGYEVWQRGLRRSTVVPVQFRWPTLKFRYGWRPWDDVPAAYRLHKTEKIGVEATGSGDSVFVIGKGIPAFIEEPWSPPEYERRGSLTLYYRHTKKAHKEYWDDRAGFYSRRSDGFAREKAIQDAIMTMKIPAEADLQTRLKAAYDWIGANLANTTLRSSEEIESDADEPDKKEAHTVVELMAAREGSGWQLDYLFLGVARALGAQANVVLAVDRTDHYFDPKLLSVEQFNTTLVAVRAPTEPDEKRIIVDPGSGLPYGQVPWWYSGAIGLMAYPKSFADILVRPSEALENLSQTHVVIKFNADDGSVSIHWNRKANGQSGLVDRRRIRAMTPDRRSRRLDEYCGSSGDFEVLKAESPGIQEPVGPLTVECDLMQVNTNLDGQTDEYQVPIAGPWIASVPELTSETRTNPINFSYTRADRVTIDIEVPDDFDERIVPSPIRLDSAYGRYLLEINPSEKGFHVERLFSLVTLGVPAKEYAALRAYLTNVLRADQTMLKFRKSGQTP